MECTCNSHNASRFNILVVDDSATVLNALQEILSTSGYNVISKSNVNAALSFLLLDNTKVDLVISDIKMPELNGFDFYSQVQTLDNQENLPFIFLSSVNSGAEIRKAKELGVDDFITKPFLPDDLLASVKGKLQKSCQNKLYLENQITTNKHNILRILSHEFRTPLVLINNGTELLKEKLQDESLAELFAAIAHGEKKLSHLVEDLLTTQQLKLDLKPLQEKIAKTTKQVIFSQLVQKAIALFLQDYAQVCSEKAPCINFKQSLLFQDTKINVSSTHIIDALQRIISNAQKFNNEGCAVDIELKKEDNVIFCCVRDYGLGFQNGSFIEACQELSQINRNKLEQQGCGLGLTIANHYIRLNNGILTHQKPEDGIGSIVKIGFVFEQ
jgi:DNA-binding response OmpR family regulator